MLNQKSFLKIIIPISFLIFFATNAFADTTRNVPADYATIQAAVDAAASGDTIQVAAGTYNITAEINVSGKALTIQSTSGAASTFVTGNGSIRIFALGSNSGSSTIDGFTISGMGTTSGNDGGIDIVSTTGTNSMTFTNNIIYGTDGNQTGINLQGGASHTVTSNRIYNVINGITVSAAGASATIQKNTIYSCGNNGIVVANATASATTYNNILKDNGTGLSISAGALTSNFNSLHGNATTYSGVTAGANDITTNPLLVSPNNGNFNLYSNSPCINAGTANGTTADGATEIGWYQGAGVSGTPSTSNIYVSGTGNDTTGDGNQSSPCRSITKGLSLAEAGATIHILAGTYNAANGESFPINLVLNNLTLEGAGASSVTIVTGNVGVDGIYVVGGKTATISGLTVNYTGNVLGSPAGTVDVAGTATVSNCIAYANHEANTVGFQVNSGGTGTFKNCIAYNVDLGFVPVGVSASASLTAVNCVAYGCNSGTYKVGFATASVAGATLNVKNSIATNCTTGIGCALGSGSSITSDYNWYYNNTADFGTDITTGGAHDRFATSSPASTDPLFISASTYDFHLQTKKLGYTADSPCLDAGTATGAPSTDLEGVTRPQGSGVDIGAYELTAGYLATLNKDANKEKAAVGDVVTYTLTIKNTSSQSMVNTNISDTLPQGFKYLTNSAKLNNSAISNPTGARTRTFTLGTLSAGTTYTLKYKTVIGSGVGYGKSTNTAYLLSPSASLSSTAQETVLIVPNPIFNAATIIGKVYQDLNKNGYPDENEPGLEDIALLTEDGFMVVTDEYGRYHLDGLKPQTKVIALDTKTLPKGAKLTTENPVLLRLTPALMMKANFGVYVEEENK